MRHCAPPPDKEDDVNERHDADKEGGDEVVVLEGGLIHHDGRE